MGRPHLNMPLLSQGIDHSALNGPAAGSTDGDSHLVVAGQAVQLSLQLPGLSSQLLPENTNVSLKSEHPVKLLNIRGEILEDQT